MAAAGRLDQMDEFFAPDYLDHAALPGQAPGLEGAKQKWAMYLVALPDMRATIEEMVAEEDEVGLRWTVEGTHRRELLGIRPTGSMSGSAASASTGWLGERSPSNGRSGIGWT